MSALVGRTAALLAPFADRPLALFGHSMGALLAFETARCIERRGLVPLSLCVSGRRAPQIADLDLPPAEASDDEFIEALRGFHGTPASMLDDRDLMQIVLPALRADFEMVRTYEYVTADPLTCPIRVFAGIDDVESSREYLEGWHEHTTGERTLTMFPGDHFFLHSAEAAVVAAVASPLIAALA